FLPAGSIILTGIHALISSTLAAPASQKGLSTRADSAYNLPSRIFPSDTSGFESSQVRALVTESIEGDNEASGAGNHPQARASPADEENASERTRNAHIKFIEWSDEKKEDLHHRDIGDGSSSPKGGAPKEVNDLLRAFLEAWLRSSKLDDRELQLVYTNRFNDVMDNGFNIPNQFAIFLTGIGKCRSGRPVIPGRECLVVVKENKITIKRRRKRKQLLPRSPSPSNNLSFPSFMNLSQHISSTM
ncbi:hypothetical protein DFH05DRAFT_1493575, partial [Lentinula detonsa]